MSGTAFRPEKSWCDWLFKQFLRAIEFKVPTVIDEPFLQGFKKFFYIDTLHSLIKLSNAAALWQLALLLFWRFVANPYVIPTLSVRFLGFSVATGIGGALGIILSVIVVQNVLAKRYGLVPASFFSKIFAQLAISVTIADGLWQLMENIAHGVYPGIPMIPILPYFVEALVFAIVQNGLHKFSVNVLKIKEEESFHCSIFFMIVVFSSYAGFDYSAALIEKLFNIAANSYWTIPSSWLGTFSGPLLCYLIAQLIRWAFTNYYWNKLASQASTDYVLGS